ncbi:efflux RND transporter periplasmic adaptor subunit [Allochromatium palmeri]|uniref:Efflux RND transporter periplasmic adaptor subunit n=1 Tax=Allochromatium palmeri TaxID=231048 RepID=A0A6N8EDV6_9GAMM|nr:efflux RND transporter periplasmic adaptor subunit [Allochromatium palmeri]MTW20524.1 efflux RND transporter periplasmic adaptor subunit [Allochromatium palmeri]
MPTTRSKRAWPGLALILMLVPLSGQTGETIPMSAEQQQAFKIEWATPQVATEQRSRRYPAAVVVPNPQLWVVAAPWSGVLERLHVAEGDVVSTGQVLAELRSPALIEAQSAYLESLIRLELAERERERDRTLQREGLIAERRSVESESKYREQSTLVDYKRQLLELAGLSAEDIATLTRTRRLTSVLSVRAPIGGVVLEQLVNTGQSVDSATALYRLGDLDPLWLEIHVPADQLADLRVGTPVWPTVLPDTAGHLITIGQWVNERDQGVVVRAEIHDPSGRLRPGQFVEVQLSTEAEAASWRLPASALVRQEAGVYVFVARPGGFEALPVTLIAREEQDAVVSAVTLQAEDRVAVSGVVALKAAWLGGE